MLNFIHWAFVMPNQECLLGKTISDGKWWVCRLSIYIIKRHKNHFKVIWEEVEVRDLKTDGPNFCGLMKVD